MPFEAWRLVVDFLGKSRFNRLFTEEKPISSTVPLTKSRREMYISQIIRLVIQ